MTMSDTAILCEKAKELRKLFDYVDAEPLLEGRPKRRILELNDDVRLLPETWQYNAIYNNYRGRYDEQEVGNVLNMLVEHLDNSTLLVDPSPDDLEEFSFGLREYHDEYWPELHDWLANAGHSIEYCDQALETDAELGYDRPTSLFEVIQAGQREYTLEIFNDILDAIKDEFKLVLEA